MEKYKNVYQKVSEIVNPVYLVGGSVRDILLKKEPKDYDFCTPLNPNDVEILVKKAGRRAYATGKRFGTIGFKLDGNFIEVTTFRQEKYKPNNRKPEVEFVDNITADLSRRDFGINAMAWRDDKFIDPFGGRCDLLERKIRSVGKAQDRIREDPLRMLRCARFMSQLNFIVDPYLEGQIKKNAYKILHISRERWVMELDKILLSDNPKIGLDFLMKNRLFNFMIPELSLQYNYEQNSPYHDFDLWEHTIKTVMATPQDIILRWSALLHDIAKPFVRTERKDRSNYIYHDYLGFHIVSKIAQYLRWSNERKENVTILIRDHLKPDSILKQYDDLAKKESRSKQTK